MNTVRIFVALLILLESSPPAFAGVPGCINGLLLNPRAYVFYVLNRQVGQPAADWEVVLQASGIPATSSVAGTVATDGFFGITQWKGSAGNVRGRLSLPTAIPDALGYLTRSVDVLADNPAWPVKCWQDSRACVWAWREHLDEPAYAPRRCPGRPTLATDFDGDGRSDATVFRPSTGVWYSLFANGSFRGMQWGGASDVPASGDYDGDGKTDLAVFRPSSGEWFQVRSSSNNTQSDILRWGGAGDRPVPADYDGDGVDDVAVYRPSNGTWYLRYSTTGTSSAAAWGNSADIPVPGDYDGDGTADIAVFRPSTGTWHLRFSSTGAPVAVTWGNEADVPISGDFDGDGALDIAIYRPVEGAWYVRHSSTGQGRLFVFGNSADIPVPADYDGDSVTDLAVFRPSTGTWHISLTGTGATVAVQWGNEADWPVQGRSMQRK